MNSQLVEQSEKLAIEGGMPIRSTLLPYARQFLSEEDIEEVNKVLRSDWLTTGPKVEEFEKAFASFVGAKEAVAVNSGTAALHSSMFALGIVEGDEVIVPTMTFAATANAVVFQKGTPVFCDCDPQTLLIDPVKVEEKITDKTKAIVAVDYAGQPCEYDELREIADRHKITLVSDACHALGANYKGRAVGTLADLNTFSFHPVKPIATGEGGMITCESYESAEKMRRLRNHCLTSDHRERQEKGAWHYGMEDLGYNYRLSDIHCALGLSQLKKVNDWTNRRREIAKKYNQTFAQMDSVTPLGLRDDVTHAYHLYVIQLELDKLSVDRGEIFKALRAENIGVNVHYIPVHMQEFYKREFGTGEGLCPIAEQSYERILSLPMFASMKDEDVEDVIEGIEKVINYYSK
ncbi:UDP-4-amino-4,6-dideoxy-N-acetyl-beta-L-altrosamine transaminase [Patescibacteria group bacterium]|nr:UDP-4-amino-4,6-dideoxy-N-acetyl-beta-L-altrosamine transaminase [Patescibacteria group bacterium]